MATVEPQTAHEFMADDDALDDLLTVQETARLLKVSVSWIYEHVRSDAQDRLPDVSAPPQSKHSTRAAGFRRRTTMTSSK